MQGKPGSSRAQRAVLPGMSGAGRPQAPAAGAIPASRNSNVRATTCQERGDDRLKHFPLITAHTGCMNTPENTLLSVETALRSEADIIEVDIRVTRDGVAVLAHDEILRLPDGASLSISQSSFEELEGVDLPDGPGHAGTHRLVRLESNLPAVKAAGKMLNLDLKADEAIEAAGELTARYGMAGRVLFTGCGAERARKARGRCPFVRRLLNADAGLFRTAGPAEAARIACDDALSAGCSGINIDYRLAGSELLKAAARQGLPVYVWTVDDPRKMRHYAELGVRGVTTRNVEALVCLKKEWESAPS